MTQYKKVILRYHWVNTDDAKKNVWKWCSSLFINNNRAKQKVRSAFSNQLATDIKLSKDQPFIIIQSLVFVWAFVSKLVGLENSRTYC